jgi:capsule polysaccharide export protein KpsE/RkpR
MIATPIFDEFGYIKYYLMKSISCAELSTKIGELAKQNFTCDSTLLYLTINVTQNQQHLIAAPMTIKPQTNNDKEKISVTKEDIKHLRKSHTEKISAVEFVSEFSQMGSMDEIYDLQELEERWRELVNDFADQKTKAALTALEEGAILFL